MDLALQLKNNARRHFSSSRMYSFHVLTYDYIHLVVSPSVFGAHMRRVRNGKLAAASRNGASTSKYRPPHVIPIPPSLLFTRDSPLHPSHFPSPRQLYTTKSRREVSRRTYHSVPLCGSRLSYETVRDMYCQEQWLLWPSSVSRGADELQEPQAFSQLLMPSLGLK